jgi:hypothetical protein
MADKMQFKKIPNTKCRYSGCRRGNDKYSVEFNQGLQDGAKWIYTCLYCKREMAWKTLACCPEHFAAYQEEVLAARAVKGPTADAMTPVVNDMTEKEYKELMETPVDEVIELARQELSGYEEVLAVKGFSGAADVINRELDEEEEEETRGKRAYNKRKKM